MQAGFNPMDLLLQNTFNALLDPVGADSCPRSAVSGRPLHIGTPLPLPQLPVPDQSPQMLWLVRRNGEQVSLRPERCYTICGMYKHAVQRGSGDTLQGSA